MLRAYLNSHLPSSTVKQGAAGCDRSMRPGFITVNIRHMWLGISSLRVSKTEPGIPAPTAGGSLLAFKEGWRLSGCPIMLHRSK